MYAARVSPNFANNLAACVKDTAVDVCLRDTMEELRGHMNT